MPNCHDRSPDPLPDEIYEDLWNEASGRADTIRGYVKDNPGKTSATDIARLADELDLSRASVFRLIKLFREGGTVASLVDRKRGRPTGHRTLNPASEEIIHAAINKHYLKRARRSISQLVRDVHADCLSEGLKPPHRRTIVARLGPHDLQQKIPMRCQLAELTSRTTLWFGACSIVVSMLRGEPNRRRGAHPEKPPC